MKEKEIREANKTYMSRYNLTKEDIKMVNKAIKNIRDYRKGKSTPSVGDRIRYITKEGDFYHNALIEKIDENGIHVCLDPYVPFVFCNNNTITVNVSGGPFTIIENKERLQNGRPIKGQFKIWGSNGPGPEATLQFQTDVTLWTFSEPDALYDGMTTENHIKIYVREHKEPVGEGYLITAESYNISFQTAFKNRQEYETFLKDHEGKEFPNPHWKGENYIVFCLRPKTKVMKITEWEKIKAPEVYRTYVGMSHIKDKRIKFLKDKENNVMYTCIISND